jgi:hypothetical protein
MILLTLPKLIFDVGRLFLMSRPTLIYGSPTDWKDVAGCLSRTHRRDVRDHFRLKEGTNHRGTRLPLNPDVEWNWSRYSSQSGDDIASSVNHTQSMVPRRRLLIAQYSGRGSYERLLQEVEPINRAYAKRWGHDYTTLIGTALKFPGLIYETSLNDDSNGNGENHQYCRYYNSNDNANTLHSTNSSSTSSPDSSSSYDYEAQSTFNKIPLLFRAMKESPRKYDQVLILDSDTMIVDFDYDITSLLLSPNSADHDFDDDSDDFETDNQLDDNLRARKNKADFSTDDVTGQSDEARTSHTYNGRTMKINHDEGNDFSYFLVAYRVWNFDWSSTWDVNAGITLWNLRHPSTRMVAEEWLKSSLSDPKQVLLKNDDQYYLQRALQKISASSAFGSGLAKNSLLGTFNTKCIRNWWKGHSFLPFVLDYFRENGSEFAGKTVAGSYNDRASDGVGIRALRDEFEYYSATVIKHFKRDTASWSRTGLEQRLLRIREAKTEICRQWPTDCLD